MAIHVVMEPPAASEADATLRAVLVRDRFTLLAFLAPLIWLLWHRLWIEALLVLAATVALVAFGEWLGSGFAGGALALLISLYVGLEGQAMRIAAMRRRGWREWGVVESANAAEAEIRYLAAAAETAPAAAERKLAVPVPPRTYTTGTYTMGASGPALGMLGYPGRH